MQGGAWLIVAMANPSASCAGGTEKSTKFNKWGPTCRSTAKRLIFRGNKHLSIQLRILPCKFVLILSTLFELKLHTLIIETNSDGENDGK